MPEPFTNAEDEEEIPLPSWGLPEQAASRPSPWVQFFPRGTTFDLQGTSKTYTAAYVGSNGYLSFGDPESPDGLVIDQNTSLDEAHFQKPRVSALLSNLSPDESSVISWKQTPGSVVVTFEDVPQ
eukprot:scaffold379586_cov33-Prasinocladus_malaysianus.AAC.1